MEITQDEADTYSRTHNLNPRNQVQTLSHSLYMMKEVTQVGASPSGLLQLRASNIIDYIVSTLVFLNQKYTNKLV